jgi:hypothetical protein
MIEYEKLYSFLKTDDSDNWMIVWNLLESQDLHLGEFFRWVREQMIKELQSFDFYPSIGALKWEISFNGFKPRIERTWVRIKKLSYGHRILTLEKEGIIDYPDGETRTLIHWENFTSKDLNRVINDRE